MTTVTIYGNSQRQVELQTGENKLMIYASSDNRRLPGTVVIFGNGSQNHTISVFFRNHKSVTLRTDDSRVWFYEEYGRYEQSLLELDLRLVGGIDGLLNLLRINECNTKRLMYDFERNYIRGASGFGTLTALAKPFRAKKRNGADVPQELIGKLFKR